LEDERDSINQAIQKLLAEYEKKRQEFLRQAELIEEELTRVKEQLLEFQPLM
jgi:F0F1-type ATP synthase membrane subunit b/b'